MLTTAGNGGVRGLALLAGVIVAAGCSGGGSNSPSAPPATVETRAYRMGRAIKAGRVWTNCYHAYPAHAAFGGYKQSGIGRENHKMMLDHYQQTKNMLVSYSPKALGFF